MLVREKIVIALIALLLIVGPYMTYKMIEAARNEDIKLLRTASDDSAALYDREAADIKRRHLPAIVFGQVSMLFIAKIGMVILSATLIRNHKPRKMPGHRISPDLPFPY